MAREPIIVGLDESPIVLVVKGVDWAFNPDPPMDFLIRMMDIAKALENDDFAEAKNIPGLLSQQLIEPDQQELWAKTEFGFDSTFKTLMAYIGIVGNPLPTEPSSQSGKPRGGAGPK